jgi:hypothetical protein
MIEAIFEVAEDFKTDRFSTLEVGSCSPQNLSQKNYVKQKKT